MQDSLCSYSSSSAPLAGSLFYPLAYEDPFVTSQRRCSVSLKLAILNDEHVRQLHPAVEAKAMGNGRSSFSGVKKFKE
jgi:hypothetical protein